MTPSAPIPIGFLFSSFASGGTERQMSELVRRLDPRRWQVHVACFRDEGLLREADHAFAVRGKVVVGGLNSHVLPRTCRNRW